MLLSIFNVLIFEYLFEGIFMKTYIISVGVDNYGKQVQLPDIPNAALDARTIYLDFVKCCNAEGILLCSKSVAAEGLGVEPENRGTQGNILEAIRKIQRTITWDDCLVFFYSGHSLFDATGYIVPDSAEYGKKSTYLMFYTLFTELRNLPCRSVLLFLNCAYDHQVFLNANNTGHCGDHNKTAVLFSATGNRVITSDRLAAHGNQMMGKFAGVLHEFLNDKNQNLSGENISLHLTNKASYVLPDGLNVNSVYHTTVPIIGAGIEPFAIRRTGFGVNFTESHKGLVGEPTKVAIKMYDLGNGTVKIKLSPKFNIDEKYYIYTFENNILSFTFNQSGIYEFNVIFINDATQEEVVRSLSVHVASSAVKPLRLDDEPFELCKRGMPYTMKLGINGGTPPFLIEVDGLPDGLSAINSQNQPIDAVVRSFDRRILIQGQVHAGNGGGTPLTEDNGPISSTVTFDICDAEGTKCRIQKHMIVYNPQDYICIPAGIYPVGCKEDAITKAAIARIMALRAEEIAQRLGRHVNDFNQEICAIADYFFKMAFTLDPHSNVFMREFLIKKYPITNHDWSRFIAEGNGHIPNGWGGNLAPPEGTEKMPVTGVSYEAIMDYLAWKGTRLPTGKEWEVAARGRNESIFPWGNEFSDEKCNMISAEIGALTPVDKYDDTYASVMGTRDMVGNASELIDRRIKLPQAEHFSQKFRGGSYCELPFAGMVFMDSYETAAEFYLNEFQPSAGDIAQPYLGFRDVIVLDLTPELEQGTVNIPACVVQLVSPHQANVNVPEFRMSRYTVSNLEYLEFVTATGHNRPSDWHQNTNEEPFPIYKRYFPVVNVSYFDAREFCLWKSRITRRVLRLPTQEQWLAAFEGNIYPWVGVYNMQCCNSIESGWGKRVPVFELREGATREGVYNLVGNVWEIVGVDLVAGGSYHEYCEKIIKERRIRRWDQNTNPVVGFRYVEYIVQK